MNLTNMSKKELIDHLLPDEDDLMYEDLKSEYIKYSTFELVCIASNDKKHLEMFRKNYYQ